MCSQLSSESPFAKRKFSVSGKEITLYPAMQADRPLIVLNTYTGDGESVMREVRKISAGDVNVLVIGNLDWNHDMTPWYCPPLSADDTAATGGADEYLELLLSEILQRPGCLFAATRHVPVSQATLLPGCSPFMLCTNAMPLNVRQVYPAHSGFLIFWNLLQATICCGNQTGSICPGRQGEKDKTSASENRAGQYGSPCGALPAAWD